MATKRIRRVLYRIGDTVTISNENPLYDENKRIDGLKGKLISKSNMRGTILLKNKIRLNDFPLAQLSAPKWFSKLSSKQMSKLRY